MSQTNLTPLNKFKVGDTVIVTMKNWYRSNEDHFSGVVVRTPNDRYSFYVVDFEHDSLGEHGFDENQIDFDKNHIVSSILRDL